MIQSVKFDSSKMNIKKLSNTALTFIIKRLIEIFGIFVSLFGILILVALISYSPEDPNFIYPENTEIKNLLGFQGSFTSDLILQSIGFIAYLIPVTFILTGLNIYKKKEVLILIENTFYIIIYSSFGSIFFNYFYPETFSLYVNGSGGFIGNYYNETFISNLISSYSNFFYYFFILSTLFFFLLSINFNLKNFYQGSKKIIHFFLRKNTKNYTNQNELINEFIPQEEIKDLIQEDLPFIKAESSKSNHKTKFLLPSIDLLKIPTKKEKEALDKNENSDPEFLEKILF